MSDWAVIKGFPDFEVSYRGQVRVAKRPSELLEIMIDRTTGQAVVLLSDVDDRVALVPVAPLVLENFVSTRDRWHRAHAIDGDPLNNHVENLTWARANRTTVQAPSPKNLTDERRLAVVEALRKGKDRPWQIGLRYQVPEAQVLEIQASLDQEKT